MFLILGQVLGLSGKDLEEAQDTRKLGPTPLRLRNVPSPGLPGSWILATSAPLEWVWMISKEDVTAATEEEASAEIGEHADGRAGREGR